MSRSFGETAASFSRCFTTVALTKNRAAISSSLRPLSRRAWKARNWSSGCRASRWTFSASESSSARPPVRTTQGTGWVLFMRFCLTRSWSARKRRPPAGTSNMPVSRPSASSTGLTLRLCRSVRRAMSSASSSIETPAFTRRTLDWLSSSLLKGMSRDALRVIFWTEAISILRDGRPRASLSSSNPSQTDRSYLSLFCRPRRNRDVEDLGAGRAVGLRHHTERGEREGVIGRQACLLADRHHRATDREAHDVFEGHHPAVDDWQAGGDAARFKRLAVVAAETSAAPEIECEAPTADREMAAFGSKGTADVIAVMLQDRIVRFAHVRIPMTGAT